MNEFDINDHSNLYVNNTDQPSADLELGEPIPLYKIPFAFFFRPGQYMNRNGIHTSEFVLAMVIWISGIAMVVDYFETGIVFGKKLVWTPESWLEITLVSVVVGILRGLVVYGLGGLWFRLRLAMCGDKRSDWSMTGRVYMLSGIAKHIGSLVLISIGALSFPSFRDYAENEDGAMVIVAMFVLMTLIIWSSFTLYFGVKAVFPVKKLWAMVWFLILPIISRLLGIAAIFIGAYLVSLEPKPMLDAPSTHTSSSFRFEYPSNWSTERDTEVPGPETWVQVSPPIADAIIRFTIQDVNEEQDQIESYLKSIIDDSDTTLISEDSSLSTFGGIAGRGKGYTIDISNDLYVLNLFASTVGEDIELLTMIMCHKDSWDTVESGFWHILKTLDVTDPHETAPDLSRTYTAKNDGVEFRLPSNWWLNTHQDDDITNDDGTVSNGDSSILVQTPGLGYLNVYVYQSSLGPRAELAVSVESYSESGRLIQEKSFDKWLGLIGFGASGIFPSTDGYQWNAKILVSELSDGRLIEIRSVYPKERSDLYLPGLDLIEETFKLRTDHPAGP